MDTKTALKRAARIEYAVLRTPLHIVDDRVVQRYLGEDSAVRQSFERGLRNLDDVVERLLRDRGEPGRSNGPSAEPAESPTPQPARGAASDLSADEVERIDTLTDELLEQQQTEPLAGELAENADLRHIQAELKAKHLVEEHDQ